MIKEYRYNFERIKSVADISKNGVVALMNFPKGDNSYMKSNIVHLHIKDGEVRNYDIVHTSDNNSNWVEDFTGMNGALIWAWLTAPDPINFYGDVEERTAANIYS